MISNRNYSIILISLLIFLTIGIVSANENITDDHIIENCFFGNIAAQSENGFEAEISGTVNQQEADSKNVRVDQIQYLVQDGNSYAYIVSGTDIYRMPVAQDETIILVSAGDRIKITAYQEESGIYSILSFER